MLPRNKVVIRIFIVARELYQVSYTISWLANIFHICVPKAASTAELTFIIN